MGVDYQGYSIDSTVPGKPNQAQLRIKKIENVIWLVYTFLAQANHFETLELHSPGSICATAWNFTMQMCLC